MKVVKGSLRRNVMIEKNKIGNKSRKLFRAGFICCRLSSQKPRDKHKPIKMAKETPGALFQKRKSNTIPTHKDAHAKYFFIFQFLSLYANRKNYRNLSKIISQILLQT